MVYDGEKEESEESKPKPAQDGQFEIIVSPDRVLAQLKVIPPGLDGQPVVVGDIMHKADEMHLKDVDHGAIAKYLSAEDFVLPTVIARGKAPVDGQDGRVDYLYLEKRETTTDPHGRLDPRSVSAFKFADKDDKLLQKYPPVEGQDGSSVFGDVVSHVPGKVSGPAPGKNIVLSPDGMEYFAAESGLVTIAGDEISVDKVLKIDGDVDFNVGNVDFDGAVIISGAIMEGFKVRATGDVMAQLVSQGTVDAGGKVVIERGIIGANGTSIHAKGDVTAKFVQNANIRSGGNVLISESILHSDVSADKNVVVRGGKHSNIVGGTIQVGGSVEATIIGSDMSAKTTIEVGLDPVARRRIQELETEMAKQNVNQERIKLALETLNKQKSQAGKLPPEKEELLNKLFETKKALEQEIREFHQEQSGLQSRLQNARPGTIGAKEAVMPGTTVTILNETIKINKKNASTNIYLDRNKKQISFAPFTELQI